MFFDTPVTKPLHGKVRSFCCIAWQNRKKPNFDTSVAGTGLDHGGLGLEHPSSRICLWVAFFKTHSGLDSLENWNFLGFFFPFWLASAKIGQKPIKNQSKTFSSPSEYI